jgi:hypothetical protein
MVVELLVVPSRRANTLPGPSRTITVEPIKVPVPPVRTPREPAPDVPDRPEREPAREPVPAR